MCEYCGCRQIEPLAELMDEHTALLDLASDIEVALRHREHDQALDGLHRLSGMLDRHVRREEDGVFTALRDTGDFLDEIAELEKEHEDFHAAIMALQPTDPEFTDEVRSLARHLSDHIDKEDLGIFPVSVVTLGSAGWETVGRVHAEQPSFLATAARPRRDQLRAP